MKKSRSFTFCACLAAFAAFCCCAIWSWAVACAAACQAVACCLAMSALRATAASHSASPALADRSKAWMCALQHCSFTHLSKCCYSQSWMNVFIHSLNHPFVQSLLCLLTHPSKHASTHSNVCIAEGQVHDFLRISLHGFWQGLHFSRCLLSRCIGPTDICTNSVLLCLTLK
jgi:hypothetical protein